MKINLSVLLFAVCLCINACSERVGNTNLNVSTQSSPTLKSPVPSLPNQYETNSNIANSSSSINSNVKDNESKLVETAEKTIDDEALENANNFWDKCILQCDGDSYYFSTKNANIGRLTFYECKHKVEPELSGEVYSSRELSESERLNGIDPLPIEYSGTSTISFQTCRQFSPGLGNYDSGKFKEAWTSWYDDKEHHLTLKKVKGKWIINALSSDEIMVVMKCSDLKDIEK